MSTLQNQRWSCRFSLLVGILLISLVPARVVAQSRTQPLEPGATQANLEIGPVEGLTTVWHEAPTETAVPLGTIVQFRIPNNRGAAVFWQGAQEVQRLGPRSVAEARFLAEGTHTVSVRYKNQRDEWIEESSVFEVIDTSFQPVRVSGLRVSAEPMELDEDDPNGSSMRYFFQDSSIAQVNEVAPGHYRTSVSRWVQLQVEVEPAAFSPLIEWRLDGAPQRHLGSGIRLQSFVTGMQTLSAGPRAGGATAELETYRVRVIPSNGGGRFVDGVPTAFRVETDPPGYEDEVTWLASTKYGTCSPPLGQGAEFETVFLGTAGAEGRWLGVKADHAKLATDQKGLLPKLWTGNLVTEAINVRLELSLTLEQGSVMGTWGLVGADDIDLGGGILTGSILGNDVVLNLDGGAVLEGTLAADRSSIGGIVIDGGAEVGTFFVAPCVGPDVTAVRGRIDASPPFSFCRIREDGILVEFENRGHSKSSPADVTVTLVRDGGVVDFALGIVPMLESHATSSGVFPLPECCQNLDEVVIEIDSQAGECSIRNNVQRSVCITDLAAP